MPRCNEPNGPEGVAVGCASEQKVCPGFEDALGVEHLGDQSGPAGLVHGSAAAAGVAAAAAVATGTGAGPATVTGTAARCRTQRPGFKTTCKKTRKKQVKHK